VVGTVLFAVASLGCALAPSLTWLLIGRALQGIGSALLMPNSLAILGATFAGEARGRAIGIWAAVGAAAGAAGPVVGGMLIDAFGWRAIFLVNLPIAAGAIALALRYVPKERDTRREPLDFAGGALAALGLAALTWGLTALSASHRASATTIAALSVGVACLVMFIVIERRFGDRAMVRMALFRSSNFIGLTLLTLLLYGALGAVFVLIPYALIESGGYSATEAGAALLPLPLVIALSSSTIGRLAAKVGPRLPLTIGPMIAAIGFVMTTRILGDGSYWMTVFPALLVISVGMAGAVAPLTTAVLSSVDQEHTGVASGFNSAIARVGGLIATALLGGALAAHGAALAGPFRAAAWAAAAAALAAGACAFAWVGRK
jgi:EmrB/QacA subfamily drug resistance transporter